MLLDWDNIPQEKRMPKSMAKGDVFVTSHRLDLMYDDEKRKNGNICNAAVSSTRYFKRTKEILYRPCPNPKVPGQNYCSRHLRQIRDNITYIDCPAIKYHQIKGIQFFKLDLCKTICKYWNNSNNTCNWKGAE